jgi:uncharacterized membrane protein (UPF0127 family)
MATSNLTGTLSNRTRPDTPPRSIRLCRSFLCRLRGLMFVSTLPPDWGLLLAQGRSSRADAAVHMLWMRFDLAIVWLDADWIVVDTVHARRWQPFLRPGAPARFVLETHVDNLDRYQMGDELSFKENPPA